MSVSWDYESSSLKPLFTVQITCYNNGASKEVDTCINITQHYCDLANKIDDCETFWVGVKALSTQHQSNYIEQKFDVIRDGQIGPPKFNLSIDNQGILVNIEPPLLPFENWIEDFSFKLFVWENGNPKERKEIISENCDFEQCNESLAVPLDTTYCISIQAFSEGLSKVGEESEEKCISATPKSSLGFTLLIVFGIVAVVILLIVLAIFFIKFQEPKIPFPKNLINVVIHHRGYAEPECKCDPIISYKPIELSEDEKPAEKLDVTEKAETTDPNYNKDLVIDGSQRTQKGERSIQDDTAVEISEDEQIHEDGITDYSKSITGQDPCPVLQNLELPRTDVINLKPTVLRCSLKPSGYDKPHWFD
ncbi:interferon gamma receptor 1 isoform X2 [Erythrolamprus reginae]